MEFFCYHRDRSGSLPLRKELREEHWSYMDRYAAQMIARGPTFAPDGRTPTGSVHIVRATAVRRRRDLAGHGGTRPGGGPRRGVRPADPGPVRRDRGPRVGVRRTTVLTQEADEKGSLTRHRAAASGRFLSVVAARPTVIMKVVPVCEGRWCSCPGSN
ncbi:YciI family protein [Micromonospora echinofusca]|uniref:YciI family protein n=1 Tax=Micromonospora echinofusca TaxID=47858 RepID=UPI00342E7DD3